jgi:transcriptional regulator with XRE-family HTH domain
VGDPPRTEEFRARARRLAGERNMSLERLAMEAWNPDVRGTSSNMLKEVLKGRRALKPHLIEAVARALGVPPEEFPEYRLALARTMLDEREVGLDQALAVLKRIERGLQTAEPVSRREEQRTAASRQRAPGAGSASRSHKAR